MNAQLGETVTLAVNVKGAAAVTFVIRLDGEELATVPATIKDGVATAPWKVDLKGNAPPRDVTFTATSGGTMASSGTLHVVAAAPVVGPLGPAGVGPGLVTLANGVLQIDVGSKLPMHTTVTTADPADLEAFVDDVPAGDANAPGKPLGAAIFQQSGVSGGHQPVVVTIPWDVAPVGTPLVRLRLDIRIAGKVVEQRRSNLVLLADWVDVTLADPPAVDAFRFGKEGRERHVFLSGEPVPQVPEDPPGPPAPPVTAQRQAAWSHAALLVELDGQVPAQSAVRPDERGFARVRFAHGTKAQTIALRAEQTFYAAAWRDAGASSTAEASHHVVAPRTQLSLGVTSRRRISLWLAPNDMFGWPSQVDKPWAFDTHRDQVAKFVDDVVLLNLFTPVPAEDPDKTTIRYNGGNLADLRRIIAGCHAASTQVLLGHGGIIDKLDQSPWLKYLVHTKGLTDATIRAQAKKIVAQIIDVDKLDVDGLDFDLEHLVRKGTWTLELRDRVRSFFRGLALELHLRGKLLGIATASFVNHAEVAPHTPATGSGSGQTFTLAIECPNILLRPMCYDNAFLDNQLLEFQRNVVKFVLSDAPTGAGIHPAQFQLGVKTFKGTNNSELPLVVIHPDDPPEVKKAAQTTNNHRIKGWYRNMPHDLVTIAKDTLSPARVGVICFGPPFSHLAAIDAALNPLPGDKKQWKTVGTPLQGPLAK